MLPSTAAVTRQPSVRVTFRIEALNLRSDTFLNVCLAIGGVCGNTEYWSVLTRESGAVSQEPRHPTE